MKTYFEHLINAVYQAYQDILVKKHGNVYPLRSAVIKFGGFRLSYNWHGKTRLGKEEAGNLTIHTKEIHLNILFAYCLTGLKSDIPNFTELFGFQKLINTIAHELAHCLLANYKLNFGRKHELEHTELAKDIEAFLWTLTEIKELERLQNWKELAKGLN